jgi:hypothetical protein
MNRRSFFKFLGIGAATAVVAPKMLAEKTHEVYPESNGGQITLKMLQDAYGQTLLNFQKAQYMYVRLAPTSLPVSAGDIVYYKTDKRWGPLAYKRKKLTLSQPMGYGIGTLTPGYYGFIQISARNCPHTIQDWEWEPIRKALIQ